MSEPKQYLFYLAIERDDEGRADRVLEFGSLDALKAALSEKDGSGASDPPDGQPEVEQEAEPVALSAVTNRVLEALHAQAELLWTARIMGSAALMTQVDRHLARPIEKFGDPIETIGQAKIYGVSREVYRRIASSHARVQRVRKGTDALPAALLMSIVATFDSNMADIVRAMLRLKPDKFNASSRTVSVGDVLRAASIDEIKNRLVNEEIYLFSRGSHVEQVEYIEENFHIKIKDHWKRWPDFVEIFERRNLVAHGEKNFTHRYVDICKRNNHKGVEKNIGLSVRLTWDYLRQSIEILLEFSALIVFSLWRKHKPDEEPKAFGMLNQTAFRLIAQQECAVAIRVLEYALGLKGANVSAEVRQMMIMNLASAHAHIGEDSRCAEILDGFDWSGAGEKFRICVAALKKDVVEVCRLLPLVAMLDHIKKDEIRDWPVFDFVRGDPAFADKFKEIFGEALKLESAAPTLDTAQVSVDEGDVGPATVH